MPAMDKPIKNSGRGRPPIGQTRMVTIGIRVEPQEREALESLATECKLSLCAYLRELVRRELSRAKSGQPDQVLRACN